MRERGGVSVSHERERGALFVAAIKNAGEGCSDFKVERGGEFEKGAGSLRHAASVAREHAGWGHASICWVFKPTVDLPENNSISHLNS